MSADLPNVGDFARVVGSCSCGALDDCLGDIVLVKHVSAPDWACRCPGCGQTFVGRVVEAFGDLPEECYPHNWLRKLPPDRQALEEIEREVVPA